MRSDLPTAQPSRQPVMQKLFDSEWNSTATSMAPGTSKIDGATRSEEHTSELQSRPHLVCRLLLEKKKKHHKNDQNNVLQFHLTNAAKYHYELHLTYID